MFDRGTGEKRAVKIIFDFINLIILTIIAINSNDKDVKYFGNFIRRQNDQRPKMDETPINDDFNAKDCS